MDLDGVSASMATCPSIVSTSAMFMDGELWGFFSPEIVSVDAVRRSTEAILPYYAVPTKFIKLDSLPLTR